MPPGQPVNNSFQIVKPEWVHSKWPDLRQLQKLSLQMVVAIFLLLVAAELGFFVPSAMAFGWPQVPML
jgi:hypothetical protein